MESVYDSDWLPSLLKEFGSIKLRLDTGRIYLQERLDPYFDGCRLLRKYAQYAMTVHLASTQVTEGSLIRHYPVHPDLDPVDGWAPMEQYLTIIRDENPHVKIMFEHRSDLVSDEHLDTCYAWVNRLMKK